MLVWQVPVALLLAGTAAVVTGPSPALLGALYLAAVTPELVRIDLREHRLPDALTLPGYPVAAVVLAADAALGGEALVSALTAGGVSLLLFLLLSAAGGMGMGDVKLAGVLGLLLGEAAPDAPFLALLLAFGSGGLASVGVLLRRGRAGRLAFGPFLLLGFWGALLLAG
jgi:leader peptidase (prepilin peptidase)/N-methyltransferase